MAARFWRYLRRGIAPLLCLPALVSLAGQPGISPGRKYSTLERMTLPRLKATHEEIEKFKAGRREVQTSAGLNDYHSILHAHGEDSAHTGGTRPEMLADAKKVGVNCIMLTDHFRPPRDFIEGSWRGDHEGVLFIPGSEIGGYLIYPDHSIMDKMNLSTEGRRLPPEERKAKELEFVHAVTEGEGLIFLSHVESKGGYSMEGLTGSEIYNNHADAMDDAGMMMGLIGKMIDPPEIAKLQEALELYPAELYAALVDYPQIYITRWDKESQKQRVVGVAANDCHHNQVFIVKMIDAESVRVGTIVDKDEDMRVMNAQAKAGIRDLTKGHNPGDVLVRLDLDPYFRSYRNCATHILAPELTEKAIRAALKAGHAYVSHDWLCDPKGFAYIAQQGGKQIGVMGDEIASGDGLNLVAEFPNNCEIRMIKNGTVVSTVQGHKMEFTPDGPGTYRVEGWVTADAEQRVWIYSNPIYVR